MLKPEIKFAGAVIPVLLTAAAVGASLYTPAKEAVVPETAYVEELPPDDYAEAAEEEITAPQVIEEEDEWYLSEENTVDNGMISHISYPYCNSAAIYLPDSAEIVYSDNIDGATAPASLTKLLTASVALKYADPDTVYTVGSEQWLVAEGSSLSHIQQGQMLTLRSLIDGMLMSSGNDAAYTIAVSVARSLYPDEELGDYEAVSRFCSLMNSFAYELGMSSSSFVNPDGWDDPGQYTTVSDLIKLASYAFEQPDIRRAAGIYSKEETIYSGETLNWTNSNWLLDPYGDYYCPEAIGIKTGTTLNAGNCLIAAFDHGGRIFYTFVTGCETEQSRYELTLELYDALLGYLGE